MNMTYRIFVLTLVLCCAGWGVAQGKSQSAPPKAEAAAVHEPPVNAYADCQGRKAGDAIQHQTREGKVAATCEESPKGLVARPTQRRRTSSEPRSKP